MGRKVIDTGIMEAKSDAGLSKACDTLLKLIDNQVNRGVKNKINQIKSMSDFGEKPKVNAGDIQELSHKLDGFIKDVVNMKV